MIKNLIFDFGKVLVDYDFEAFFRNYIPDNKEIKRRVTEMLIVCKFTNNYLVDSDIVRNFAAINQ